MRADEQRVVDAFCRWLEEQGWTVHREVDFVDVLAERDGITLLAEAKGRTASTGLDMDTAYGQLLRRMKTPGSSSRYALVVPTEAVDAALRVEADVRDRLGIEVFEVTADGRVREAE